MLHIMPVCYADKGFLNPLRDVASILVRYVVVIVNIIPMDIAGHIWHEYSGRAIRMVIYLFVRIADVMVDIRPRMVTYKYKPQMACDMSTE